MNQEFKAKATALIDDLKGVCANYGLGNDGNEFKIITQIFLYKFLNDKFAHEVKRIEPALAKAKSWEDALRKKSKDDYEMLLMQLGADTAARENDRYRINQEFPISRNDIDHGVNGSVGVVVDVSRPEAQHGQ